jgi:hypothetical protein
MVIRIIKNPPVEEKQLHTVRRKCKDCGASSTSRKVLHAFPSSLSVEFMLLR